MTSDARILTLPPTLVYVIIAIVVFFVSTRLMNAGPGHIFALLLGGVIITHLQAKLGADALSFNAEMDYRIDMLGSPSHFHLDTNLINLFYSIYGWRKLNASNFENAIKACNNVLRLRADAEKDLARCVDNYEIAYEQSRLCLNFVHSFVYVISQPLLVKKLQRVLSRLQQLLERNLLFIKARCDEIELEKPRRDIDSRFIEDVEGPKAYDPYTSGTAFDYYT
jgi:hypothetical protein